MKIFKFVKSIRSFFQSTTAQIKEIKSLLHFVDESSILNEINSQGNSFIIVSDLVSNLCQGFRGCGNSVYPSNENEDLNWHKKRTCTVSDHYNSACDSFFIGGSDSQNVHFL